MAAALGTRENLALLQPRNSHEIAFLPSLDLAAGIEQRIGSARLGTPSLGAGMPSRQGEPRGRPRGWGGDCGDNAAFFHRHDDDGSDWFSIG
jgi:hypothetical protein